MRDRDRIARICAVLEIYWGRHPDLSLCRIIVDAAPSGQYIEDVEDGDLWLGLQGLYQLDRQVKR